METTVKDIHFNFDLQIGFTLVTIGDRAAAVSALMSADDLDKLSRIFSNEARKLRGDT